MPVGSSGRIASRGLNASGTVAGTRERVGGARCAAAAVSDFVVIHHKVDTLAHTWHKRGTPLAEAGSHCCSVRFAPRLDSAVVESVRRMDVDRHSVADIWREAADIANSRGAIRPSYHSILNIVLEERRRRAERREAVTQAIDQRRAYRGVDYGALARRLAETRRQ